MKKQSSGFTLIELVVVIVIIGVLAATAIPRFTNLTDNARQAVAEGVLGAVMSSAVIQFGANNGQAVSFNSIISNVDIDSNDDVAFEVDSGGTFERQGSITQNCAAGGNPVTVRVDATDATAGGQIASGVIPDGLCNG